jgi:hypothetical protein
MLPQPGTPFFGIITIPPLYRDMGMVMIGCWGVSRVDEWGRVLARSFRT